MCIDAVEGDTRDTPRGQVCIGLQLTPVDI